MWLGREAWWEPSLPTPVSPASRFHVFHATAPLLTHTLRMLPEVWFDPKQNVVRLEADRGSTRSRPWFDSKQIVVRLEA